MIALLVAAAFAAGLVDAIAGGGGILTVPALLAAGLPPVTALGTNKGQAVFGALTSAATFLRARRVDLRRAPVTFAAALAGSLLGARAVFLVDPAKMRAVVLGLLTLAAALSVLNKPATATPSKVARAPLVAAAAVALPIGFYDGFFGPGTGTFFILVYAYAFGDDLVGASANSKIGNLASNLAAFSLFALSGAIRWDLALPMGAAQLLGASVGARLAVRRGARLVRALAIAVSLSLAARVAWQMLGGGAG
ncbi:MAG: TSUP family transporter [Polyangiaceae bacterium]|nr:TSUP family transporter [Polyangiaceae bacterium]